MRWAYVQAIVTNSAVGSPGAIRFRHHIVEADDADTAYFKGMQWAQQFFSFQPQRETINDYVISLDQPDTPPSDQPAG